jgi:ubiquinone/menaquinone biosynthesis C-methylase UbiE
LFSWLRDTIGFSPAWRVADVGSGTGIFSRLLLEHGNPVHAVEPNDAMRAAAESSLAEYAAFTSVRGCAEATTLPDHAFQLVTAAQAFHWFEPVAARREFHRILAPGGSVLVVFNSRRHDASPLMRAYENFLREKAVDYRSVDHRLVDHERLHAFLGDYLSWRMNWSVEKTLESVVGFSSSSSYAPAPEHPAYEPFYAGLRALFDTHQQNGTVEFFYETEAYVGTLR